MNRKGQTIAAYILSVAAVAVVIVVVVGGQMPGTITDFFTDMTNAVTDFLS